jgi:hypothetical protein
MDVGWMHWPYFAWLMCKYRSEDYIANVCNGVEQLQLEWTDGLDSPREHWGELVAWMNPRKHWPYFAWLICKYKSEDYITDLYNGIEHFQLEWTGSLDSRVASMWACEPRNFNTLKFILNLWLWYSILKVWELMPTPKWCSGFNVALSKV